MEPKDPSGLSDEDLERRLREEALARYDAELQVQEDSGTWWVGFERYIEPPNLDDLRSAFGYPASGGTRREALEKLWGSVDLEDDLKRYRSTTE